MRRRSLIACLIFFSSISAHGQKPEVSSLTYSVFLVGDAGEYRSAREKVLKLVSDQLSEAGERSTIIFLGDNIYQRGLPPKDDSDREFMEGKLTPQLDVIRNSPGKGFIIPGNHDWDKSKENGWNAIKEQESFTTDYTGDAKVFLPKDGCPGPAQVKLTKDIIIVIIDSQWPLHKNTKPGVDSDCRYQTLAEMHQGINDIVKANLGKQLIFAAHHPIYTYGNHGGSYSFVQHAFPIVDAKSYLYIPLPILGSIYPLYRKAIGNIQDVTNNRNKAVMDPIRKSLEAHPAAIHVSGHEHALQHIVSNNVNYIVSGSGSKTEHVKKKKLAKHAVSKNGFSRINFYSNGEAWVEFWVVGEENSDGILDYDTILSKSGNL